MSEEMRMAEHFPECFQVKGNYRFEVQDAVYYCFGEKYETDSEQDSAIQHAVLNHDQLVSRVDTLTEQVRQLREALYQVIGLSEVFITTEELQCIEVVSVLNPAKQLLEATK